MKEFLLTIGDKLDTLSKKLHKVDVADRKKLGKRLKFFLLIYIPVVCIVLVMAVNDAVLAGGSSTTESTTEEPMSIKEWIDQSLGDNIYQYAAGQGAEEVYASENNMEFALDSADYWNSFVEGYIGVDAQGAKQSIIDYIILEGESYIGSGSLAGYSSELEDIPIIGKAIPIIINLLFGILGLYGIRTGVILLRLLLGLPWFFVEQTLAVLGPSFMPGSVFGVIMGRVGSGGVVKNNYFGFELLDGNVYGIISSIIFGIMSSIATIGIAIKVISSIASAAWNGGSGESRKKLKDSLTYNLLSIFLISIIPFGVYIVCYIRDAILFEVLRLAEWASTTTSFSSDWHGAGAWEYIGQNANQAGFLFFSRATGFTEGRFYNPFLVRAFDFTNGTLMDTLMYSGSVLLLLVFMFLYVSLALDTAISFAFSPMMVLAGKQSFIGWVRHMVNNLLTPVIDGVVLCIPLLLSSLSRSDQTSALGIGFIQLIICFSYFPLRKSIRARMNLSDDSGEGIGMGSMMGTMMAFRMLSNGASKIASNMRNAKEGADTAKEGAELANERANEQLTDIMQSTSERGDIERSMKEIEGIEPDNNDDYNSSESFDYTEAADDGDIHNSNDADDISNASDIKDEENEIDQELAKFESNDEMIDNHELQDNTVIKSELDRKEKNETKDNTGKPLNITEKDMQEAEYSSTGEGLSEDEENSNIADKNIKEAIEVSKQSNTLKEKAQHHRNLAEEYGNKALKQEELIRKDEAGLLSDEERKTFGYTTSDEATAKKATFKLMQSEHQGAARRYSDLQRQSDNLCNRARQRMGIGGHGALTASEINSYSQIQAKATLQNFQSEQMHRSLSPDMQAKLYMKAADAYRGRIMAGVGTTTAMAAVVGAGSCFLPTGVKAGALGAATSLGASVIGQPIKSTDTYYNAPKIKDDMLAARISYFVPNVNEGMAFASTGMSEDIIGTVQVNSEDRPYTTDPDELTQEGVSMYNAIEAYIRNINGKSAGVYGTGQTPIRSFLYNLSYEEKMIPDPNSSIMNTYFDDDTQISISPDFIPKGSNTPIDLSKSKSQLTLPEIRWIADTPLATGLLCWYGDIQREMERSNVIEVGKYPPKNSEVFRAMLAQPQINRQITALIEAEEGIHEISADKKADYLYNIESIYAKLRELCKEECTEGYISGYYKKSVKKLFSTEIKERQ